MKTLNQFVLGLAIPFLIATVAHGDGFTPTGNMNYARWNHTATRLLDGRVLVAGGRSADDGPVPSAELYNPVTGTWTTTSSFINGEDRDYHTATLLPNGKVLVAGGLGQGGYPFLVGSQLYDPSNGTWTLGGPSGFYGHTATLLANGKVLIAGGTGIQGSGPYSSAILYDPASNSSSFTGSLGKARYFHTATLLANGEVLVAGGVGANGNITLSAELYNPATGTWSPTGNPLFFGNTATLLPNGKVLAVEYSSAELYDPATSTWSPTASPVATHYASVGTQQPNGNTGAPATMLYNGRVLIVGGGTSSTELYESSLNPISKPIKLGDGSIRLGFNNPGGPSYHVLASTDIAAPVNTWSNLGPATETSPGSGQFQFTDHQAPNFPQRSYRVTSP